MSVQTRSRSDKNAAVLGSKKPRQVPAFLNGLHRHTAPLPAANRAKRISASDKGTLHARRDLDVSDKKPAYAMRRVYNAATPALQTAVISPYSHLFPKEPIKKRRYLARFFRA